MAEIPPHTQAFGDQLHAHITAEALRDLSASADALDDYGLTAAELGIQLGIIATLRVYLSGGFANLD